MENKTIDWDAIDIKIKNKRKEKRENMRKQTKISPENWATFDKRMELDRESLIFQCWECKKYKAFGLLDNHCSCGYNPETKSKMIEACPLNTCLECVEYKEENKNE